MTHPLKVGGIILCGGRSSRMGQSKALLSFGPETMLSRVVRILGEVVSPIVVVAAQGQALPQLPPDVLVTCDKEQGLGPLAGLASGLGALAGRCDAAYFSSCDVPLLRGTFVQRMIESLGDFDFAVPHEGEYYHPLAGVYRIGVEQAASDLVAAGRLRPIFLFEVLRGRAVPLAELRPSDSHLDSLRNVNTPEEYSSALRAAGLSRD